jgi:RNA polymerase sigma-70 factor (ECF subfamily)
VDADGMMPLLRLAAGGDEGAFTDFVRLTMPDVVRMCRALVDDASVDDAVQETYVRAYQGVSRFRSEASPLTWLLAVARRVCADEWRAKSRRRSLAAALPPSPHSTSPHEAIETELLLDALSAERREAFVLTQLIGLSYLEAARVCGCELGTIRSRVARARADLIAALSDGRQARSV